MSAFSQASDTCSGEEIEKYSERILDIGGWMGGILLGLLTAFILFKYLRRRRLARRLAIPRIGAEMLRIASREGDDLLIVDIRSDLEVGSDPFTLPGAHHIPLEQFEKNPHRFPPDREIILYCS